MLLEKKSCLWCCCHFKISENVASLNKPENLRLIQKWYMVFQLVWFFINNLVFFLKSWTLQLLKAYTSDFKTNRIKYSFVV